MTRFCFYKDAVKEFIKDKSASILVIGGGECDRDVFLQSGFDKVVILNIDVSLHGKKTYPYKFILQDAHQLAFKDDSFDYTVALGVLHHCQSPHGALLEMYRVARVAVLAVESRDNLLIRLSEKFKLSERYEIRNVCESGEKHGGVNNREMPNYIYRWSENEIEKTIASFAPYAKHEIKYKYGFSIPTSFQSLNVFVKIAIIVVMPFLRLLFLVAPKQQNLFAFFIKKPNIPSDLFPWLLGNNKRNLSFRIEKSKVGGKLLIAIKQ